MELSGCGPLTAAKLVGETAGVQRFRSRAAYASHNGTAPFQCGQATLNACDSIVVAIAS